MTPPKELPAEIVRREIEAARMRATATAFELLARRRDDAPSRGEVEQAMVRAFDGSDPAPLLERIDRAYRNNARDTFDLGFSKGRRTGLQEVKALAPHEVTCRCSEGGEFEWSLHDDRCPRRQLGEVLKAIEADERGLPQVSTPVRSSPSPDPIEAAPTPDPERRFHDSAIVVTAPGGYLFCPMPWVAWEIEVKQTSYPPPSGFDKVAQRLTITSIATARSVEEIAEVLHEEYEEAAEETGWQTQKESRVPWRELPEANKATMIRAIEALLARHTIDAGVKL